MGPSDGGESRLRLRRIRGVSSVVVVILYFLAIQNKRDDKLQIRQNGAEAKSHNDHTRWRCYGGG